MNDERLQCDVEKESNSVKQGYLTENSNSSMNGEINVDEAGLGLEENVKVIDPTNNESQNGHEVEIKDKQNLEKLDVDITTLINEQDVTTLQTSKNQYKVINMATDDEKQEIDAENTEDATAKTVSVKHKYKVAVEDINSESNIYESSSGKQPNKQSVLRKKRIFKKSKTLKEHADNIKKHAHAGWTKIKVAVKIGTLDKEVKRKRHAAFVTFVITVAAVVTITCLLTAVVVYAVIANTETEEVVDIRGPTPKPDKEAALAFVFGTHSLVPSKVSDYDPFAKFDKFSELAEFNLQPTTTYIVDESSKSMDVANFIFCNLKQTKPAYFVNKGIYTAYVDESLCEGGWNVVEWQCQVESQSYGWTITTWFPYKDMMTTSVVKIYKIKGANKKPSYKLKYHYGEKSLLNQNEYDIIEEGFLNREFQGNMETINTGHWINNKRQDLTNVVMARGSLRYNHETKVGEVSLFFNSCSSHLLLTSFIPNNEI